MSCSLSAFSTNQAPAASAQTVRPCYTRPMTQPPDEPTETPIQRALRLKKAAIEARPKPPRGGAFQRTQAAAKATGSKPWMKK